jgi:para-nitrobenzyl esterase
MAGAPLLASAQVSLPVAIDAGKVTGTRHDGVAEFKGIPFAAPPVGPLRWRAPQPAAAWHGVKAADHFGAMCYQAKPPAQPHAQATEMSEDCLTLNVFTPDRRGARRLPVMVWIYGGAMIAGASSLPAYDGQAFARGGVVFVSFNYRVGRLGIFAHPALSAENADGGRLGNYALMDQIAALRWVSRNIAAFGGDPRNVTIFGESAGGLSTNTLMVAPPARHLFQRAITQSGYGRAYFRRLKADAPDGRKSAESVGTAFATDLGLANPTLAQLRAVPAAMIVAASKFGWDEEFSYILDGKTLTDDMWATFRAGREAPVPFLLGSNSLEEPSAEWRKRVMDRQVLSPDDLPGLSKAYGGDESLADNLLSDIEFTEQARALARLHAKNGFATYLYLFSVLPDAAPATLKGARHGSDVRYVFGTVSPDMDSVASHNETDASISRDMNGMWRAFASTGEPNGKGLPHWPRYDGQVLMEFTRAGAAAHADDRRERLDALSAIIDSRSH